MPENLLHTHSEAHAGGYREIGPDQPRNHLASNRDRPFPIPLICRSGIRSGRAAMALQAMGVGEVYTLTGGTLAWRAAEGG